LLNKCIPVDRVPDLLILMEVMTAGRNLNASNYHTGSMSSNIPFSLHNAGLLPWLFIGKTPRMLGLPVRSLGCWLEQLIYG
jgi:hypothetical protein